MYCFVSLGRHGETLCIILKCLGTTATSHCRVHVVFGLVISGFEVIKKIEGLKADSASRPYADVRVVDCGQLITKSANDGRLSSINNLQVFD